MNEYLQLAVASIVIYSFISFLVALFFGNTGEFIKDIKVGFCITAIIAAFIFAFIFTWFVLAWSFNVIGRALA